MESSTLIVGDYRIDANLGKKEKTAVYHAVHEKTGEEVVIRFFIPTAPLNRAVLRRFEYSVEKLKKLDHPNLVGIRSSGVYRGAPYLVSSYIPGDTLRQKLSNKPLPWAQAARLLLPVAIALTYLHEYHIPHRNVNASNILTAKGLMLVDSGVRQLIELIDPQPVRQDVDSIQQDICDLGRVYYEMITGTAAPVESGHSAEQVKNALLQLREQHPELPPAVLKMLRDALLPEGSFDQMSAFAQALEALGRSEAAPRRQTQPQAQASKQRPAAGQKSTTSRRRQKRRSNWLIPVMLLVLVIGVGGIILINKLLNSAESAAPQATGVMAVQGENETLPEATATAFENQQPAAESTLPQPSPTPEPTLRPEIGSVTVSAVDGMQMVYVPAGEFVMGSDDREEDEKPMHNVYLDAYWIDRTEVTNGMYTLCVQAGACDPPVANISSQQTNYYNNADFADYPVIYVTWQQANDYCTWAGRRLPTEAEWEKAARGTQGDICPWGNTSPSSNRLNYNSLVGDTTQVGSYPAGTSVYGALDMSGNVWEWVSDWYSSGAYSQADYENPTGPEEGTRRVLRGGSWYYALNDIRAANRFSASENTVLNDVGFRCVLPIE